MPKITRANGPSIGSVTDVGAEDVEVSELEAVAEDVEPAASPDEDQMAGGDASIVDVEMPAEYRGASIERVQGWLQESDGQEEFDGRARAALKYELNSTKPRTSLVTELRELLGITQD